MIKESQLFEDSRALWRLRLMKSAILIASLSILLNMLQGIALIVLIPLKKVEPYILEVNKFNSEVRILHPLDKPVASQGEEVDKFFITEYIRAREGYDWGLAERMFQQVKTYSKLNAAIFNEYNLFIHSEKSPLVRLQDKARVVIDIQSITLDEKTHSAAVRFSKTVITSDGEKSNLIPRTYWIGTLRYEYPNPQFTLEERQLNPLGMQIISYQLVQEIER